MTSPALLPPMLWQLLRRWAQAASADRQRQLLTKFLWVAEPAWGSCAMLQPHNCCQLRA